MWLPSFVLKATDLSAFFFFRSLTITNTHDCPTIYTIPNKHCRRKLHPAKRKPASPDHASGLLSAYRTRAVSAEAERTCVLVPYSTPLESAAQVRKVAVAMHMEAFAALGFAYRLRSGYYQTSAAIVVSHTGGMKVWLPLTGAIAASAYYYLKPSKP